MYSARERKAMCTRLCVLTHEKGQEDFNRKFRKSSLARVAIKTWLTKSIELVILKKKLVK